MEPTTHQQLVALGRGRVELLDSLERRLTAELEHHVALRAGDRKRLSDRPAALRNDGGRPVRALEDCADRALGDDLVVHDQARTSRDDPAGRHAANDRQARRVLVQMIKKKMRRERVRIREHDQDAVRRARGHLFEAVEDAVLVFFGVGEGEGTHRDTGKRRGPR